MTVAKNRYLATITDKTVAMPVTSDQVINQGDLVFWDQTNYTLKPVTVNTQVNNQLVGVCDTGTPVKVYNETGAQRGIVARRRGLFRFLTAAGQTYRPGDSVTVGADAQTVTPAGATTANRVGVVILDPPLVPRPNQATPVPESVTGAVGVEVTVMLLPQWPNLVS